MRNTDILFIFSLCSIEASAFLPNPSFHTFVRTLSTTGELETALKSAEVVEEEDDPWVIRGIRQDEIILEAGEGGVSFAEESAIRCSGLVEKNENNEANAECLLLDHFKQVRSTDGKLPPNVNIIATGVGVDNFEKIGSGSYSFTDFATAQEIEYAPIEAGRAVARSLDKDKSYDRLVVNILGGDDLVLSKAMNATEIIARELSNVNEIVFNSLSFKDFSDESVSIVCVAMEKLPYLEYDNLEEEDVLKMTPMDKEEEAYRIEQATESWHYDQLPPSVKEKVKEAGFKLIKPLDSQKISGITAGEIYIYEGKYLTVSDIDMVKYTDSDSKLSYFTGLKGTDEFKEFKELQDNKGKDIDFDRQFELYEAVEYLQEEQRKLSLNDDRETLFEKMKLIEFGDVSPEIIAEEREYLAQNYNEEELKDWGYNENSIDMGRAIEKAKEWGILVDEEEYEEDMNKFMKSLGTVMGVELKDEDALIKLNEELNGMQKAMTNVDTEDESLMKKLTKDEATALKQFPEMLKQFRKIQDLTK